MLCQLLNFWNACGTTIVAVVETETITPFYRWASLAVQFVHQEVQAQASSDRTRPTPHRRKALRVLQVLQTVLAFRLLQPAHQPPLRVVQAAHWELTEHRRRRREGGGLVGQGGHRRWKQDPRGDERRRREQERKSCACRRRQRRWRRRRRRRQRHRWRAAVCFSTLNIFAGSTVLSHPLKLWTNVIVLFNNFSKKYLSMFIAEWHV